MDHPFADGARRAGVALAAALLAFAPTCAQAARAAESFALTLERGAERLALTVADLAALPQHTIVTGNEYVDGSVAYTGPLARDVIALLDLDAFESLHFAAANDYSIDIPTRDFEAYDVILATKANGEPLSRRDKGPIWLMYPIAEHEELARGDYVNRLIWQLVRNRGAVRLRRGVGGRAALAVLACVAVFAVLALQSIRRDVESLRIVDQDNILWAASQMEVELLRFQLAVADLAVDRGDRAAAVVRERFDILWSRMFMSGSGRVGAQLARYDVGHDSIPRFQEYLRQIDPVIQRMEARDAEGIAVILRELETFQRDLRLYVLRASRGDMAAAAALRARIEVSAQATAALSVAAILLCVVALALILRDNRRQREIAENDRRLAREAERASRAKSRFLGMISHELRNPLNAVLGPLALLGQSDLTARQRRLVDQARQAGGATMQMAEALIDYGEIRDGGVFLRSEPFRIQALADGVREDLAAAGHRGVRVAVDPGAPDAAQGDLVRLRQIFVNLAACACEGAEPRSLEVRFSHDGAALVGEIGFDAGDPSIDWKLSVITGLGDAELGQVSSESLRPLIARGLITAARGVMSLVDGPGGRRAIRVAAPAPALDGGRVRVLLESRSAAVAAIYRAALRSERVAFVAPDEAGPVDVVLVDAGSVGEDPRMAELRARFPSALFVSLGEPERRAGFDEVVDGPSDVPRLRSRIFGAPSARAACSP